MYRGKVQAWVVHTHCVCGGVHHHHLPDGVEHDLRVVIAEGGVGRRVGPHDPAGAILLRDDEPDETHTMHTQSQQARGSSALSESARCG